MESYLGNGVVLVDHRVGSSYDKDRVAAASAWRAVELGGCGVSRQDRVVIGHGSGPSVLADLMAVWSLGAAAVMVSRSITLPEKQNVLAATRARAWIADEGPDGVAVLPPASMTAKPTATLQSASSLDDPALIMMTSGTTSQPKGVVLTHRALQARIALNLAHIGSDDLQVALSVLPMHFGHGLIGNILTPMAAGSTLVIWPEPGAAGLPDLGKVIDDHRVTFMSSVPSLWRVATRLSPKPHAGSLRRVHVGSAPLAAPLWQEICAWCGTRRVLNMYGITETSNWIGGWSAETGDLRDNLIGKPWGGQFRVVAEDGSLSLTGRGEVAVNTPSLMAGYFELPELTNAALVGDWFRTGDIGQIEQDGNLTLVGRSKFEINKGGIKIPAEEIDALLERHPAIAEACAFSLPDSLSGETVAAAIVFKEGAVMDVTDIRQWCEANIRREAAPSKLFVLDMLPRTDRGKLNRDRVREASLAAQPPSRGLV